jgi:Putative endonuclease segE, GIY-YIG domain
MTWFYNGRSFDEAAIPVGIVGFVYKITCLPTGRAYYGQKRFTKAVTRKPLKGRKRKRRSRVSSNWLDYWGSSQELLNDVKRLGPRKFSRVILYLCKTKSEMNYRELSEQILSDVLLHPDKYYNSYVGTRIHTDHLRHLRVRERTRIKRCRR